MPGAVCRQAGPAALGMEIVLVPVAVLLLRRGRVHRPAMSWMLYPVHETRPADALAATTPQRRRPRARPSRSRRGPPEGSPALPAGRAGRCPAPPAGPTAGCRPPKPRRPIAAQIGHDHPPPGGDQRRHDRSYAAARRGSRAAARRVGLQAARARYRRWRGSGCGRCGVRPWPEHAGGRGCQGRGRWPLPPRVAWWKNAPTLPPRLRRRARDPLPPFGPASAQTGPQPKLPEEPLVIVTRDGTRHAFKVEMALSPDQQTVGLMFRPSVAPDGGMLFDWGTARANRRCGCATPSPRSTWSSSPRTAASTGSPSGPSLFPGDDRKPRAGAGDAGIGGRDGGAAGPACRRPGAATDLRHGPVNRPNRTGPIVWALRGRTNPRRNGITPAIPIAPARPGP